MRQAEKIAYFYMDHFTNEPMERLADRLISVAAPEMARVRFASSGSEANETALRLARAYHVDRGEPDRWRVISWDMRGHGQTETPDDPAQYSTELTVADTRGLRAQPLG